VTAADATLVERFGPLLQGHELCEDGGPQEKVRRVETPEAVLETLYAELPARLPPLYERLILTFRWPDVELGRFGLVANPAGPDLAGLLGSMRYDRLLWSEIVPAGLIPFGRGTGFTWDPVCFDTRHRTADGDCRIVQLDHEAILCYSRIRDVAELARSFRQLMRETVARLDR
jgi:hypothetical protein